MIVWPSGILDTNFLIPLTSLFAVSPQELHKASLVFEKDQDLHQRLLEEGFVPSSASEGSKSPRVEDQVRSLTSHIEVLKHRLTQALRAEEQSKAAEKSEREVVRDLQTRMGK